jgi:23S rRNA-/tRNA-specific pseudouridylate synthase
MSPISYLYKNTEIFAVDKPAGIHSVRAGESGGSSIADLLLAEDSSLAHVGTPGTDAGLVTRLDYSTSGILLGAYSSSMWDTLHDMITRGEIEKRYVACVEGHFPEHQSVTTYIGTPHRGARKMKIYEKKPSKAARALEGTSDFKLISYDQAADCSLVEIAASPARRHQIRIHTAYLGHPLVGDSLYGSTRSLPAHYGAGREFFLHAHRVSFGHPSSGRSLVIESPYGQTYPS